MEEKIKKRKFEKLALKPLFAASVFPVAIYMYFCAQNQRELTVSFIVASSAVLFLLALAAYFAVYLIVGKCFAAMAFCLLCWTGCYAYGIGWVADAVLWLGSGIVQKFGFAYLPIYTLIVLAIAVPLTVLLCRIRQKEAVARFVLAVSLLILAMNGALIAFNMARGLKYSAEPDEMERKMEFAEDSALPSPNIYWIHPDGMLGFDAVEKYYGDPQEELEEALASRGFAVSRSANFEAAHSTRIAVPILANPCAYDSWISGYTADHEEAMKLHNIVNGNTMESLRRNSELQTAFNNKGYAVNLVGMYGYWYPIDGGYLWEADGIVDVDKLYKYEAGERLDRILSMQSQLENIAKINGYFNMGCCFIIGHIMAKAYSIRSEYRAYMPDDKVQAVILEAAHQKVFFGWSINKTVLGLYDLLNGGYDSPRITVIHNLIAHAAYKYSEDGSIHENSMNPLDYYPQHIYSGRVVLGMVDMILEADPDAVIIIQADHGLHGNAEEDFKQAFGDSADAVEIWNSTMSAVRIPEQYINGDEGYMMDTPLNITRYLVNSFVGKNYEYLAQ